MAIGMKEVILSKSTNNISDRIPQLMRRLNAPKLIKIRSWLDIKQEKSLAKVHLWWAFFRKIQIRKYKFYGSEYKTTLIYAT